MRHTPQKEGTMESRSTLLIDGIGCLVGGVALGTSRRLWQALGLQTNMRLPFAATLTAFGAFLGLVTRQPHPTSSHLRTAALGNIGWTIACLRLSRSSTTSFGRTAMSLSALADLIMATLQFNASRKVHKASCPIPVAHRPANRSIHDPLM